MIMCVTAITMAWMSAFVRERSSPTIEVSVMPPMKKIRTYSGNPGTHYISYFWNSTVHGFGSWFELPNGRDFVPWCFPWAVAWAGGQAALRAGFQCARELRRPDPSPNTNSIPASVAPASSLTKAKLAPPPYTAGLRRVPSPRPAFSRKWGVTA
jgi:hypothetical protein